MAAPLVRQRGGHELERQPALGAQDPRTGSGRPIASSVHQPLDVLDALHRRLAERYDAGPPGRRPARCAGLPARSRSAPRRCVASELAAARGPSGRGPAAIPMYARRTRPSRISAPMIARVVSLIGTARPSPTPATAVLIPTTRARPSASAPPEFPGLSAASVWMTLSMKRTVAPERAGSERPSAETTPR